MFILYVILNLIEFPFRNTTISKLLLDKHDFVNDCNHLLKV